MPTQSRRAFMASATALGFGGSLSGCASFAHTGAVVASRKRRDLSANERIRCGFVGVGSRGGSILSSTLKRDDVEVVAVCDTYDDYREGAVERCKKKRGEVADYVRFEDMIEKEALDAVVVATPDHVHGDAILHALNHKLDVYSEKPMTLTWKEAKAVRNRAQDTGAVFQVGTQLRSMALYQKARDLVQDGAIGTLVEVNVNRHYRGSVLGPRVPDKLDESRVHWDVFQRDAKKYKFDARRYFEWRQFREYSNGALGDLMLHHIDQCHFITGCSMAQRVMSVGGIYFWDDGRTVPDTVSVLVEYPEGFHFNYTTTAANAHYGLRERYLGSDGTIEIRGMGAMSVYGKSGEKKEVSDGPKNDPHLADFFDNMRFRGKTIAPVEAGFMAATCAHMAVLSQRSGESAKWDPLREQAII
jgi:predicted dehydrogenase